MNSIILLFCLFLCITIHELAHMVTGKFFQIPVKKFSIGFGKAIYSKQINSTYYQIGWIPLGGYVEFGLIISRISRWKKIIVCLAGPLSNLILAVLTIVVLGWIAQGNLMAGIELTKELFLTVYNAIVNEPVKVQSIVGAAAEINQIEESAYVIFIMNFIALNLSLGIFNLIPLPPLDGGNIVLYSLPRFILNSIFTKIYQSIGLIIIIGGSIYLLLSDILGLIF